MTTFTDVSTFGSYADRCDIEVVQVDGRRIRTFLPAYRPRVMMATRPTLRNFMSTSGVGTGGVYDCRWFLKSSKSQQIWESAAWRCRVVGAKI
jgi:hypothetical protein